MLAGAETHSIVMRATSGTGTFGDTPVLNILIFSCQCRPTQICREVSCLMQRSDYYCTIYLVSNNMFRYRVSWHTHAKLCDFLQCALLRRSTGGRTLCVMVLMIPPSSSTLSALPRAWVAVLCLECFKHGTNVFKGWMSLSTSVSPYSKPWSDVGCNQLESAPKPISQPQHSLQT